ncbi:hyccin [Elysia marginata]|uniref:Hyccin n=1 Tax=Elysia marginata TaxID=1093978 RepID=A0AAV4JLB1_9GAST|nr:hyccin [Elysia marginata]
MVMMMMMTMSRIGGDVLTEHNLRQLNNVHGIWRSGPFKQHSRFNAQNRNVLKWLESLVYSRTPQIRPTQQRPPLLCELKCEVAWFSILSHVMLVFNNDIDSVHSLSLEALCRVTHKLCSAGFAAAHDRDSQASRIALQPSLLIELLTGIYFAMFNGHSTEALKAVEAAHKRASYELYSDVLLVTNGLLNSHQPDEAAAAVEHKRKKPSMMKNFITNASFKAKKLPDDIEIVDEEGISAFAGNRLTTVDEEGGLNSPAGADHTVTKGFKARLMTKLSGDKNRNKESSFGSVITGIKRESMADYTMNNAGRRDSDMSAGSSSHQPSPRWDGEVGSRRESESQRGVSGRESDASSLDSVGVAVKTFSLGGAGDRGGGSKVVVDMLEMEPIKGKQGGGGGGGSGGAGDDEEETDDLYDHYNATSAQTPAPRQGLWSPPATPSPTSSPGPSPLIKVNSKKTSPAVTSTTALPVSQVKTQSSPSGSGVDPQSPDPPSITTPNGKAITNNNTSSGSSVSRIGSNSSSRFSYSAVDGTEGVRGVGVGVSQSKTSPSLAAEQQGSGQSIEKSPSTVSSPPSSASSYQSPRDAFFGITEASKSQKLSSTSNSQSGSNPTHNSSNSAPNSSSSASAHSLPGEQAKSASKVNRNSYSTDL